LHTHAAASGHVRIVIADDHAIVRMGLRRILENKPGFAVVGEAQSAEELLRILSTRTCDAVILDISMPGRGGLDVIPEIRQGGRALPVLVLSMHAEDQLAIRSLRAGAAGYMNKECAPDALVAAVRRVVGGGRYVSETLAEKLALEVTGGAAETPQSRLSNREYQVLCLLGGGRSMSEIADQLCVSIKTASTYRTRILEKLGMQNNAQLIRFALDHGIGH
jgi:two-component system, NarL family, invasion response regulator UvrY